MEKGKRLPGKTPTEKLPVPTVPAERLDVELVLDKPALSASDVVANQGRQIYPDAPRPNNKLVASD